MPINQEQTIIGIDPGIADTGYGLIKLKKGQLELLTFGSIKTPAHSPLSQRILTLHQELTKIISAYRPEVAVVEQLFFCNNAKTAFVVGQARGAILLTLAQFNLKILELTPLQVKQGLTGYGQAEKKQIQQMVKILLNLKEVPRPDDAADALAMAICGSSMIKFT